MDHSSEYPTLFAACKTMAPELDVGVETLLIGVVEAQIDAGVQVGPSNDELEEIRLLRAENHDLRHANEIVNAAYIFSTGELDPRRR